MKAIYYGCANDKFGGCGSVGNLMATMQKLGNFLCDLSMRTNYI